MSRAGLDIHHPFIGLACKSCFTLITDHDHLLSKAFRGHAGKGALFSLVFNVSLDPPCILLMNTGAYTIQEFACSTCRSYLGWKIIRAHEEPEKWKEGKCVLELELLVARGETVAGRHQLRKYRSSLAVAGESGHRRAFSDDSQGARERPLGPRPRGLPSNTNRMEYRKSMIYVGQG
ncbi:hypothetical protein A0H81_02748 [Grifola frondosa]|uniref:Yippee domain-containing protein n=1 Tax=Grifola frondosa TaxID=5627 RepID=A0A1C7MKL7_GRIFR|nr:hypothetical protein A0H81_02748 [Grifola frondosa]